MLKVISANLNGIRSAVNKGFLEWMPKQNADFVCLQELKAQADNMTEAMLNPAGYQGYFHYAEKKGYSGVGIYARHQPLQVIEGLGVPEIDAEGRYLELVYDKLSIISVYLPSGSSGDHRQAAKYVFMEHFFKHLAQLVQCGRQVILCGDWNIAHKEIDLKNWKGNQKNSGFLPEERAWLTKVFDELGWADVYRQLHPDSTGEAYTWWSNRGQARANNVGWRIDYQIATKEIAASATAASIYKEAWFSDHAPLTIDYEMTL
ncbi:exodeoxyribonuclease III [Eoetvoesiella caeni]|uniref:Exodeoxyribonuclease-3 n=1 Tax=Eoetvoesiella caeni TaxID=645616 RepID=A0A366HCH5_9BURK|nr:exodeoxyribonuclease III [Eoetvoesiella caeni]MCI2808954.1 exodeoxyribonuclease III [Eoetvoesiella caeni]NYT55545.1 exodeoxyribonuclease III [Eoetvoesiella caeni]RBP40100.1 exodeoxyribonuclease-3 [Eoetvoesiella caeni]